jgi:hypothetical protein
MSYSRKLRNFIRFMFTKMSMYKLLMYLEWGYITQKQFKTLCWIKFNFWN